jgi:hypothetical protein
MKETLTFLPLLAAGALTNAIADAGEPVVEASYCD